jgi:molybdopterin-guanine dinucleotide biosynthesis protein A
MLNAVVLAGDKENGGKNALPSQKAFVEINNRPMLAYVLDTLMSVQTVGQVAVVGPKDKLESKIARRDVLFIDGRGSMFQNLTKAVEQFENKGQVLVLTCDIPMVTREAVEDFIEQTKAIKADFYYPIVSREDNDKKYPGVSRTYVKLKDGTFTGGNLFLINAEIINKFSGVAERVLSNRKKPWRLAKILGWGFVVKFALGNLVISELEATVSKLFGIKAKAVISHYPEIGTDVDKPSDLVIATRFLTFNR